VSREQGIAGQGEQVGIGDRFRFAVSSNPALLGTVHTGVVGVAAQRHKRSCCSGPSRRIDPGRVGFGVYAWLRPGAVRVRWAVAARVPLDSLRIDVVDLRHVPEPINLSCDFGWGNVEPIKTTAGNSNVTALIAEVDVLPGL